GVGDSRIWNQGRITGSDSYRQVLAGFIGRAGADASQVNGLLADILVDPEIADRVKRGWIIDRIYDDRESVGDRIDTAIGGAAVIMHNHAYCAGAKGIRHRGERKRAGRVGVRVADRRVWEDRRIA